jgi:glycosyl transferase family 25
MELPIDKIFYINLDSRTDRREHFESHVIPYFKDLELRLERFPAIQNSNGAIGCSLSHLAILKKAKQEGYRYCLILEDDFQFLVSKEVFYEQLHNLFNLVQQKESPLDFKVIMLAYNAINQEPFNDFLDKTTNAQTTAGYIVNSAYYDELITCWEEGYQLFLQTGQHWNYSCDQYWKQLQKEKWFLFKTRIGRQIAGYSDCGKRYLDNQC